MIKSVMGKIFHHRNCVIKDKKEETPESIINKAVDDALLSEAPSEVSQTVSQVKKEFVDPLLKFAKEHPDLKAFITSMSAGGLAGLLVKKAEEKKEISDYLKNTEKFVGKMVRRDFFRNSMAVTLAFVGLGSVGGYLLSGLFGADFGARMTGGLFGSMAAIPPGFLVFNDRVIKPKFLSKDGKFLCTNSRTGNFVTIPPSGNKLIFCRLLKDSKGQKIVPEKEIELGGKAVNITFDEHKEKFSVHYEDSKKMTKFSFDGKML